MADKEGADFVALGNDGAQDKKEEHERHFGFFYWPGGPTIVNFGTHESPKEIIGSSAYAFFLIPNIWSFLLALLVVVFQFYLFWILWEDAGNVSNEDFRDDETEWILGIFGAIFMLALRVLSHIGQGMQLMGLGLGITKRNAYLPKISFKKFDPRLVFVAAVFLIVSVACVFVGIRFSLNKGASVFRTITSSTIALFIEGIDESMYSFLKYWSRPEWINWADAKLQKEYGDRDDCSGGM